MRNLLWFLVAVSLAAAARAQQQDATQPKREPKERLVLTTAEIGDFEADRIRLDALFEQKQVQINKVNAQTDQHGGLIHPNGVNGYHAAPSLSVFHDDDGSTTDKDIGDVLDDLKGILTRFASKQPAVAIACAKAKAAILVYGEGYETETTNPDHPEHQDGIAMYYQSGDWRKDSQRIKEALSDISEIIAQHPAPLHG